VKATWDILLAVFLVVTCGRGVAQELGPWQVPEWRWDETARLCDEHSSIEGGGQLVLYPSALGSEFDSEALKCLRGMHRLFYISPGEDELDYLHVLGKLVLVSPLMRKGNAFGLITKPRRDIYVTFAKRLMLYQYRLGSQVEQAPGAIAIDTHVHTSCSPDSLADCSQQLLAAAKRGLAGIAVTDHNSFEGSLRTMEQARRLISKKKLPAGFLVIPGEEISSSDGHIVGLFLRSEIPPNRSAAWTVKAIHDQGGIAIAAHPLLPHSLGNLANTLPFDAVETENAAEKLHYAMAPGEARKRRAEFYVKVTRPRIGSSDAHDPQAVGQCYTLIQCKPTLEAVREAILAGRVTPVGPSDEEEASMVRHGLPRALALYMRVTDLTPWLQRATHSGGVGLTLTPRPVFTYSRQF
jgi:predicted metal-dependent phosphoesterase TrpH